MVYQNSTALHIWLECLLRASFEERDVLLKRQKVTLDKGQFVMGYREMATVANCSVGTVKNWMDFFETERMIERYVNAKGTLVTIKNWDQYQSVERNSERYVNAKRTQREPNKKEEEGKEGNKNVSVVGSPSEPTPAQAARLFFDKDAGIMKAEAEFWMQQGVPEAIVRQEFVKFVDYWTERNKSGTKQRWETQKTFEVRRRLRTWLERTGEKYQKKGGSLNMPEGL